ncbi:ead/Ea22-like family protein [Klebsiella pneumoniae]|nr:ead/Ea22-like family protein [Klebsiella pneumoniae]MDH8559152.1 ead/Ea22-like family protein [Klebsiella pneumoniae]
MTDITELAQSLKAAAENAIGAHERLAAYPYGEIIDISQHEGEQIDIDITDLNEFNKEANPVNILALVEALEKAQQRIAELESRTVTAAAADVLAERQRQVTAEGWSFRHDDQYKNTELAFAASCYAFHAAAASWDLEDDGIPYDSHPIPKQWPWDPSWWKPTDARRDLVKAGALILAEIERIDRASGIKVEAE